MKTLQSIFSKVAEKVSFHSCDAFVSFDSAENFYLTGFDSSFGVVLVNREGDTFFFTDGRYFERAKEILEGVKVCAWKGWGDFFQKLKELKLETLIVDPQRIRVSVFNLLKSKFSMVEVSGFLSEFRAVKSEEEVALISRAVTIAETAIKSVLHLLKPGITELEFRGELVKAFFKYGGRDEAFETIVASGVNSAIPHHKTSYKEIKEGEVVIVDFGVKVEGYVSDITRTYFVGSVPLELKEIYDVVREAQEVGIKALRSGVSCKSVDEAVRNFISSRGYGDFFVHSTGHGIGVEVHESPTISKNSNEILKSGAVVTVEPGIYLPQLGGVRIEDDCLVTKEGAFLLSTLPK